MRVFLARHGETEWNAEHRLQGQSDTALTARGRAHAQALSLLLAATPLAAVYTSTLRRAVDTAGQLAAARGLEPQTRPELVEIGYGVLEGRTAADPDPVVRELWAARKRDPLGFRAPGGESYADLWARVAPFAALLVARHTGHGVLVVGHRGTNRVLLGLLLGRTLEESLALKQKHDCVLEIRPRCEPECVAHRYAPVAEPKE